MSSEHRPQRPQHPRSGDSQPVTARSVAWRTVRDHERSGAFLAPTLERYARGPLSPSDRGLAVELSHSLLRRMATLDAVLKHVVDRPRDMVEPDLWLLFRLGAVQLLLLPSLPQHAAIHETVELAKEIGMPRWTGIVNGVLRSVSRLLTEDYLEAPSPSAVPLIEARPALAGAEASRVTVRYRRLSREVFSAPEFDRAQHIAEAFSLPRWLIDRWLPATGPDEIERRAAWFATPGHISLRVNLLRVAREPFLQALRANPVDAWEGNGPESVRLAQSARIQSLPGFNEGWFSVQDESALVPSRFIDPQPGETVLDLCAAPGGKSTHLAELMDDRGRVVACDVSQDRIRAIEQSAERLGLNSIETRRINPDGSDLPDEAFDAALVDAPCTNTGVLGKRPEVRWRLGEHDFSELPDIQSRLLESAASRVKPGGRLVYSTCSIDELENELMVRRFVAENAEWTLEREVRSRPGFPADGGFAALLTRR